MKIFDKNPVKDKFLTRMLVAGSITVVIFFLALGWIVFRVQEAAKSSIEKTVSAEQDLSHALYLDMVLSGFAKTAVTTGEIKWESRYKVIEPKFQMSLENILSIVPDKEREALLNQTLLSGKTLRDKEKLAFSLLRDGINKQSYDLLYDETYERDRETYYNILSELGKSIKAYEDSLISHGKKDLYRTIIILVIVFPVIFLLGFTLFTLLNRWQEELRSLNMRLSKMLAQSESLVQFSRKIGLLNLDQLKLVSREMFPALFHADLFSVFLLDPATFTLKLSLHNHLEWDDLPQPFVVPENDSIMWDVIRSKKLINVEKFGESCYYKPDQAKRYDDDKALCVPLLAGGAVIGVLNLNYLPDDTMRDESFLDIQRTADHFALAVNNILLYEQNAQMAVTDELTKLYNRRFLFQDLAREVARAKRYDGKLSILMTDIDHFKKINDTYGHSTGDVVLKYTAQFLSDNLRPTDTACRFGGEEFVIILPGTSGADAIKFADRIRIGLAAQPVPYEDGKELRVTISIGVTEFRKTDESDILISRADEGLYVAKNQGRNKCVLK